ncbi:MAG: hypothetical protein Q8Q12_05585 [bacterium]|nr:hypothetical protein [bacterium]
MNHLAQDKYGKDYYWVDYSPGCLSEFPWPDAQFDCGVFIHASAGDEEVEQCIREILQKDNQWVITFGKRAEYWHDQVDRLSLEANRQDQLGDGDPMTAWWDDVATVEDLEWGHCNFGPNPFLFIFVGSREDPKEVEPLRRKVADW